MTGKFIQQLIPYQSNTCNQCQSKIAPCSCASCHSNQLLFQPLQQVLPVLLLLVLFIWFLIYSFFADTVPVVEERKVFLPKECRYLSHLYLDAELYQPVLTDRMACMSSVRYFGYQKQHAIRYTALGTAQEVNEMRLSLRAGSSEKDKAISELIRFGNSLSLPTTGHAMPLSVGRHLREGKLGHWQLDDFVLLLVHRPNTSSPQEIQIILRKAVK